MTRPTDEIRRAHRAATGARLRWWRLKRGLSQKRLAGALGITQATLSNYETGKRELMLHVALAATDALDVSMRELVAGTDTAIILRKSSRLAFALQILTERSQELLAG